VLGRPLVEVLPDWLGGGELALISGFNAETVDRRASMPAGSAFLEKPFESTELLATLRSLLHGPGAGQASSA
jgi:DNA-binding response OmpR family regulator